MKLVLTACLLVCQLFGINSVGTGPVVNSTPIFEVQKTKEYSFSKSSLHTEFPAENVHAHPGVGLVKTREQRLQQYVILSQALQALAARPTQIFNSFFDTPAPFSIGRFLLFPKHYFW